MENKTYYPLVPAQKSVIMSQTVTGDKKKMSVINTFMLLFEWNDEPADFGAIKKAGNMLIKRNNAFGMRFRKKSLFAYDMWFEDYEYEDFEDVFFATEEEYNAWLDNANNTVGTELFGVPLYHMKVLHRPDGKGAFWIALNQMIGDGYSFKLMHEYFSAYYYAYVNNEELPNLKEGSYLTYMQKEHRYAGSDHEKADEQFWKQTFKSQKNMSFPAGQRKSNLQSSGIDVTIDGEVYKRLQQQCAEIGCSQNMFLLSAMAATVYALTGKHNFSVATVSYGRMDAASRRTIGNMASAPYLMYTVNPKLPFGKFALSSYRNYLEMLRHVRYPDGKLFKLSLWQSIKGGFNFNYAWLLYSPLELEANFRTKGITAKWGLSNGLPTQLYCLVFNLPEEGAVELQMKYQVKAFTPNQMQHAADVFTKILVDAVENPDVPMEVYLPKYSRK